MTKQLSLKFRLDAHTRLEDYVGDAAARLSSLDGLVVLRGEPSSGKTHLLQGLCHEAESRNQLSIYLPELGTLHPDVLIGIESSDLVCLDDIGSVFSTRQWQESLFHLINACKDSAATLVLGDVPELSAVPDLLPDLASRLNAAYSLQTDVLNDADKLDVIRRKAAQCGFDMPEEVCRFILSRAPRDMNHLAALVMRLDEESLSRQKKVTIPFVKTALGL